MRENKYQQKLVRKLKDKFPDCTVLHNNAGVMQGIPDLLILNGKRWAALETKRNKDANHRPNQDYYVDRLNKMSYASFVYPENEQEVLDDLERVLGAKRKTRSVLSK